MPKTKLTNVKGAAVQTAVRLDPELIARLDAVANEAVAARP